MISYGFLEKIVNLFDFDSLIGDWLILVKRVVFNFVGEMLKCYLLI